MPKKIIYKRQDTNPSDPEGLQSLGELVKANIKSLDKPSIATNLKALDLAANKKVHVFVRWKNAIDPVTYPNGRTVWPTSPGLTHVTIDLITMQMYEKVRDDLVSGYNGIAITEIQLIKPKV